MKLSTIKCQREGCPKFTPIGKGGFPVPYCGMACFRQSKPFAGLSGKKVDKVYLPVK